MLDLYASVAPASILGLSGGLCSAKSLSRPVPKLGCPSYKFRPVQKSWSFRVMVLSS